MSEYRHRVHRPRKKGSKLDAGQVQKIRGRLDDAPYMDLQILADEFGVTKQTIRLIQRGKIWKGVEADG